MNKEQKQEVIEALKNKFSQYSNFYITDTQNLSVAQITNLRRHCFDKQVEMKVAKNTLIKKALESLDNDRYSGVYDSLHQVTALMFSDSPKEPALIISSFRKSLNGEKPLLKAAFLNGDIFVGDNQLVGLTKIKTKNELIGEVIGLLMSPIQRVIGALQNRFETAEAAVTPVTEAKATEPVVESAKPEAAKPEVTESKAAVTPVTEAKAIEPVVEAAKPEATKPEVTESKAAVTPVTEAKATEPVVEAAKPEATKPEATESKAAVTPVTEAKATEPVAEAAKPEAAKPEATESKAAVAPVTEAKATEPVVGTAKPEEAKPEATESKSAVAPEAEAKATAPVVESAEPGATEPEVEKDETQPGAEL